jgi:hypothetical protein
VKVDVTASNFDFTTLTAFATQPAYASVAQTLLDKQISGGPGSWATGARTGIPLEGPYLVYRAGKQNQTDKMVGGRAGEYQVGMAGHFDPKQGDDCEWVFDLAVRRPIYLPYPGTLEVIGQLPGVWEFTAYVLEGGNAEKQSPIESEVTLTCQIAPQAAVVSNRTFSGIPFGAHSYTYRDSATALGVFPSTTIILSDDARTDVTVGGITLNGIPNLKDYANQSSQFYGRWGLANAMQMLQNGAAIGSTGALQFHVSIM